MKKTFKNNLELIFKRNMITDGKKYRLPYYISIIKEMLNLIYFLGGFLALGGSFSMFLQFLGIKPNLWVVVPITIFIPLLINYIIVYFSPLVEVKENIDEKRQKENS
jgi:hypothetical protein